MTHEIDGAQDQEVNPTEGQGQGNESAAAEVTELSEAAADNAATVAEASQEDLGDGGAEEATTTADNVVSEGAGEEVNTAAIEEAATTEVAGDSDAPAAV